MGGAAAELEGPDLAQGVDLDSLPEWEPFAGHADGEAVVLVRRRHEVTAIGGTCSHYGAPLSGGLVVADTIRCPWHHACFSLRTGEAIGAPALNPLPTWDVDIDGGRVKVTRRREAGPLDARGRHAGSGAPRTVAIVGAGAAGSAAAEQLRREGHDGRILLIDPDEAAPYDRPNLSKDYLAGTAEEAWIPLRPRGFYEEHGIERVVGSVASIDSVGRTLRTADGRAFSYEALLLATGARPIRLRVPGADLPHVHVLRTLRDCRGIIAAAQSAKNVVVIGASFIGMETAAALRSRGLEVTVVAPERIPFERTLGDALGTRIHDAHREHGVRFELGRTVAAIDRDEVVLDDGTRTPADLVIVGIGVRPDLTLAEAVGAGVEDGVLVNEHLETSVAGIFAAGDIARWPAPVPDGRIRIEHWMVAQRMGQAAARSILGQREPFTDVPFFWTAHFDLVVAFSGYAGAASPASVERGDDGGMSVRYARDRRQYARATIGRDLESLRFEAELEGRAAAGTRTTTVAS
ncbi:MAG TPA: FAD-dependent oxidoreductase [Longimicrobiales bacterium]|nr:FAD-dependent oxidoreductase [Longimicrobiales bacterium]